MHLSYRKLFLSKILKKYFSFRLTIFRDQLSKAFMEAHTQTLPITKVEEALKDIKPHFEKSEIRAALNKMQDENQVMVAQDNVFLI